VRIIWENALEKGEFRAAVLIAALIATSIWLYYAAQIGIGDLSRPDEFSTLDRSAGFSLHHDWLTVYSKGEPSFRKPPLQYWMSALLLKTGIDPLIALRLPSIFFALATLAATGLLAYALAPNFPWAIPGAILVLCGSTARWQNANSALLDSGATFFVTASLATIILALTRPRWWLSAGLLIGLGSIQKAPVPLLLLGLLLLMLHISRGWTGFDSQSLQRNPHFKRGLVLALVLSFAWPCLQLVLHGVDVLGTNYSETIKRFIPVPLLILALLGVAVNGARRWTGIDLRSLQRHSQVRFWLLAAVMIATVWLLLQAIRNGQEYLQIFLGNDATETLISMLGDSGRNLSKLNKIIIDGEWIIRGLGTVALLILPFSSGRKYLWPLFGIMMIYIVVTAFASGRVYGRYSLLFEPMQAAAIAAVLAQLLPKVWLHVPAILITSVLSGGPIKPRENLQLFPGESARTSMEIFKKVGAAIGKDELLVVCQFSDYGELLSGAAAYYAAPGRKIVFEGRVDRLKAEISKSGHLGPLRGVCRSEELMKIQQDIVGLERLETIAGYVLWRATGWAPNL
jgi:4-amino-4-deoxy-L-arabinose transferase-like glycosyltransferase